MNHTIQKTADNGAIFLFYRTTSGVLLIDKDNAPYMEIFNVLPNQVPFEIERFMDSWNHANPR